MTYVVFFNIVDMKFLNSRYEQEELTYEDVFLLQNYFEGESRFLDVNVRP